jgi:hypothetical protein
MSAHIEAARRRRQEEHTKLLGALVTGGKFVDESAMGGGNLTAEKAVIHTAGVQAKAILLAMQSEGCEDLGPGEWGHDLYWTEADTINGLAALVALLYGARHVVGELREAGAFPGDPVEDESENHESEESEQP